MRCQLANAGPRKTLFSLSLFLSLSPSLLTFLSLFLFCTLTLPLPFSVSVFFYHHLPFPPSPPSTYLTLLLLCLFFPRLLPLLSLSPTLFFPSLSLYISLSLPPTFLCSLPPSPPTGLGRFSIFVRFIISFLCSSRFFVSDLVG